ncbi:hypothetical protein NUW54_g1642 [Trametes sanguinea]|uniref:Uncharacterized protein n=1 Tax=Trametes sanguinea TaxID=158606 RepID=A0ACC1Q7N6_9APHY|nr:hypothetical protein NUW54_g1642 [Trametes sanguinea]
MPEQRKINPLPILLPPNADYTKQTIALPGTERPGQTREYHVATDRSLAAMSLSKHGLTPPCTLDPNMQRSIDTVRHAVALARDSCRLKPYRDAAQFELVTLDTPGVFTNLLEVWDEGFRRSKGGPFLAHRPVLSKKPLKLANHYEWQTWTEVDARRRAIGSAVHRMQRNTPLHGHESAKKSLTSELLHLQIPRRPSGIYSYGISPGHSRIRENTYRFACSQHTSCFPAS